MREIYAAPVMGSRSNTFNQAVWNSDATKSTTESEKGLPVGTGPQPERCVDHDH